MATRTATVSQHADSGALAVWTGITEADSGSAVDLSAYPDKTVQVVGDFTTSGAITIQGSMDNTNWGTLHDPQGTTLVITDTTPRLISENTKYIRPTATAGTAVSMDVYIRAIK